MNNSPADRRSPMGLFRGKPTARFYDRAAEILPYGHWHFLLMPTGKVFVQVSLDKS